ncbi:MAG: hypothetical protein JEZ04_18285 [Spirochaetales bacterium]|nr:hypothetical protein [Spirochaetales bacterium]
MYGASGIQSGQYERIGDGNTINSSTMTMIMSNEGTNFKFTGATTIARMGCVIDANDNDLADDGDYVGGVYNYLMAGSTVLTLNYNP